MKRELDSSIDRPNAAQVSAAYQAGVRVWGGYIGIRPLNLLGLQTVWSRADFDVVLQGGMAAIGYCSGWDDPLAIRNLGHAWGVLPCVDVEPGIRDDGPWLDAWLGASGAGLYGLQQVHYETGRPIGRLAAFNIMANYPGFDPQATWNPLLTPPVVPHGWQWQGTHTEFGLSVDSNWLDDALGVNVMTVEQIWERIVDWYAVYLNRWAGPDTPDWPYVIGKWTDAYKADPVAARAAFGQAAAAEVQGQNIYPVRQFELVAAIKDVPAGPTGPPGPAGPNTDIALRTYLKGAPS